MPRKLSLNAFLTKENVSLRDCFNENKLKEHEAVHVPTIKSLSGKMYMYAKESGDLVWKQFFHKATTRAGGTKVNNLIGKSRYSVSAAIAIPVGERFMIFTFGHGASMIQGSSLVHDFGKKVLTNSISIDNFIAIRSQYYDRYTKYSESQSTVKANASDFELDFELQILQKMTGDMSFEEREEVGLDEDDIDLRMTGSNSLSFNSRRDLSEIGDVADWLVKQYLKENQSEFFKDLDTLVSVKSKAVIDLLDLELVKGVRDEKNQTFQLIVPTMINYSDFPLFRIKSKFKKNDFLSDAQSAPSIFEYREFLKKQNKLTSLSVGSLKTRDYLDALYFDGSQDKNIDFNLYRCLCGEVEVTKAKGLDKGRYALIGGKWFKVDSEFFERMISTLKRQVSSKSSLSPFNDEIDIDENNKKSENEYNLRQNKEIKDAILFDREKIMFRGRGSIEPCDLLIGKKFYHVKRFSSSSTLSHLFFQGMVAADALVMDDQGYRKRFLEKVPKEKKKEVEALILNKKFEVVYSILIKETSFYKPSRGINNIPSFSIVSLYKAYKEFKRLGIKLSVELIFH